MSTKSSCSNAKLGRIPDKGFIQWHTPIEVILLDLTIYIDSAVRRKTNFKHSKHLVINATFPRHLRIVTGSVAGRTMPTAVSTCQI